MWVLITRTLLLDTLESFILIHLILDFAALLSSLMIASWRSHVYENSVTVAGAVHKYPLIFWASPPGNTNRHNPQMTQV